MPHRTSWTEWPLLVANLGDSRDKKNLLKPVLDRRVLDDMESDAGWHGSPVVDLSYTTDRARSGTRSLRVSTLLRNPDYIDAARQPNGTFTGQAVLFEGTPFSAVASKRLAQPEDWTTFNRISLWCYVHPTDHGAVAVSVAFLSDGASAGPHDPIAVHYFSDLEAGAWNHLVWEFPEIRRDAVSELVIFQPTFGVTGADPRITYDFDSIELQRVDAEVPTGWDVAAGTIAYSHFGYQPAARKVAVTAPGASGTFEVISDTGEIAATFPTTSVTTPWGSWTELDFSQFTRPGSWRLRYDGAESAEFPLSEDCHLPLVAATLNAYYGLRCGWAVPGVHGVCHHDVFSEHEGDRRHVAGGWHDAANLTQGPGRTHLSIYALCELADSLADRGASDLADRAREEAWWGADWSLRTRWAAGLRCLYNDVSYYTDGDVGTEDDVLQEGRGGVGYDEFQNILGVLAMSRAARTLASHDPETAERLKMAATEDFAVTYADIAPPSDDEPVGINESSWRDRVGYFCLAAVELFRITQDDRYRDAAIELGRWVVELQERTFVEGIAVAGYFYEDAARTRIVHEYHDGFEDSGLLAMAALRDTFPDHEDWIEWHAGLSIYADHFCQVGSGASAPFGMIPAAVWRAADIDAPLPPDPVVSIIAMRPSPLFPTPPTADIVRDQMVAMFEDGLDLGADHRLRRFPLWSDHVRHGATTVHLGKVIGLAQAAIARGSRDDMALASRQLEWVIGANPFSRSLVYGVGHDWWQNFSAEVPNLVGGLSLGFNSYEGDSPAWGNNAVFPYKEQWVYSSSRLAMLLARVGKSARVVGEAPRGAEFVLRQTGESWTVDPGELDQVLPAGDYEVRFGEARRDLSLVDGTELVVNVDPSNWISVDIEVDDGDPTHPQVAVRAFGEGSHSIAIRGFNVEGELATLDLTFTSSGASERLIPLTVVDPSAPWVLVAIPDGSLAELREIGTGLRPLTPR